MALPALKFIEDCADFSQTVTPYLPQLYALPQQLLNSYSNTDELRALYLATNPLISTAALAIALTPLIWLASEVNKNYSQVDRLWSILPTVYIGNYVLYGHMTGVDTERLYMLLTGFIIWSVRLTFNYWRKGGYSIGHEDYRWALVKAQVNNEGIWFFFNLFFIAIAQSILLFLISTPAYILLLVTKHGMPMTKIDSIFPRVVIALVLLEFMADQQQWNFQKAKTQYKATAKVPIGHDQEDLDRGFIVTGLWSLCRHPNFACEQAIWVVLYQWSCFITDSYYNWTGFGALGYLALFQGSTWLTEKITKGKYPEYAEYQQRVAKFLPRLSSDLPGDFSDKKDKVKVGKAQPQKVQKGSKSN